MATQPDQRTYALHVATADGRLTIIDITEAVKRAHFLVDLPDGTTGVTGIGDALPGNPDARLAHRIMLVTCNNPEGSGDFTFDVDPEADRVLASVRK